MKRPPPEGAAGLAERVGFEPTVQQSHTTVFETVPINHSGTSPRVSPTGRPARTAGPPGLGASRVYPTSLRGVDDKGAPTR